MKPLIAITGNSGQLGKSLQQISSNYPNYRFLFLSRQEIDLGDLASIDRFFQGHKPNIFINCAAYTAVDKAENEQTQALTANAMAVSKIAQYCAKY
jgi:dTDP-4-dehydrorhamnose reductase